MVLFYWVKWLACRFLGKFWVDMLGSIAFRCCVWMIWVFLAFADVPECNDAVGYRFGSDCLLSRYSCYPCLFDVIVLSVPEQCPVTIQIVRDCFPTCRDHLFAVYPSVRAVYRFFCLSSVSFSTCSLVPATTAFPLCVWYLYALAWGGGFTCALGVPDPPC